MKTHNAIIIGALIAIVFGFIFTKDYFNTSPAIDTKNAGALMEVDNYVNYSETSLSAAKKKGTSVLFFAATDWCQTCSQLEKEIIERSREIPGNTTILKVDYDNDKVTNKKYSVTTQHTLVVLDPEGQESRRWVGGGFDTVLSELKKI